MKILKAVVFSIAGLLMAACLGILVCALNPSLTAMLAEQVEHMAENNGQEDGGTGTDGSLDNVRLPGMPGLVELPGDKDIYQVPENMPDAPSGELGSLSGYQPVQQENQQIAQEEADSLSDILATGQSGEGLAFDREMYPYYAMLEQDMQQIDRKSVV